MCYPAVAGTGRKVQELAERLLPLRRKRRDALRRQIGKVGWSGQVCRFPIRRTTRATRATDVRNWLVSQPLAVPPVATGLLSIGVGRHVQTADAVAGQTDPAEAVDVFVVDAGAQVQFSRSAAPVGFSADGARFGGRNSDDGLALDPCVGYNHRCIRVGSGWRRALFSRHGSVLLLWFVETTAAFRVRSAATLAASRRSALLDAHACANSLSAGSDVKSRLPTRTWARRVPRTPWLHQRHNVGSDGRPGNLLAASTSGISPPSLTSIHSDIAHLPQAAFHSAREKCRGIFLDQWRAVTPLFSGVSWGWCGRLNLRTTLDRGSADMALLRGSTHDP